MLYDQSRPPKSQFSIDDIPDLTGKVVIVTGGNAGVGKETVYALLRKNAKVYMASRSRSRALPAIEELKGKTGKEAIFLELDLASLKSIKRAVEEFTRFAELYLFYNEHKVEIGRLIAARSHRCTFSSITGRFFHLLFLCISNEFQRCDVATDRSTDDRRI